MSTKDVRGILLRQSLNLSSRSLLEETGAQSHINPALRDGSYVSTKGLRPHEQVFLSDLENHPKSRVGTFSVKP